MQFEHLCDGEYRYDAPPIVITPYGGREAVAFGGGDGWLTGERLSGTTRWSNFPRRREDGTFLPNVTGVIETDDGATVLYETTGVSLAPPEGSTHRLVTSTVRFHADAEPYRWLNAVVAVEEGVVDAATGVLRTRIWVCAPEEGLAT